MSSAITPSQIGTDLVGAFAGFAPALETVAVAGLGVAIVVWGFPRVVGMFKKTAK